MIRNRVGSVLTASVAPAWITAISVLVGVVGALVATAVSVREYQLKARTQRAETEINLARLLAELIPVANGRGPGTLSEAAVSALASTKPDFSEDDLARLVVTAPVGVATQAAAIASLGRIGQMYVELRRPVRAGLDALAFVDAVPELKAARLAALRSLPD